MRKRAALALAACVGISVTSCAAKHEKKVVQELKQPIHCATAEGDLRALGHEKTHVAQQIAAGVSAVVPIGLVVGVVTGTEKTKFEVATGEYNKMIDKKIAEIKATCGVK